jgi:hypothetical protein
LLDLNFLFVCALMLNHERRPIVARQAYEPSTWLARSAKLLIM